MKCKFFNFFFVACVFSFLSCRDKNDCAKNGCPPEYTRFELGEALPYLWAKPGSYWIYKHSQTGALDTQTVTNFLYDSVTVKGTEDHSQHRTYEYDKLIRNLYSSFNQANYHEETNGFNPNSPPDIVQFNFHRSTGYGDPSIFHFPFVEGQISGTGAEITTFIGIDTLYILHGKTYIKIVKFGISIEKPYDQECIGYTKSTYYWAKHVGLIKKDYQDCNFSWELIDYKINR